MGIRELQERLEKLTGKPLRVARELPPPAPVARGAVPLAGIVEGVGGDHGMRRVVYRAGDAHGLTSLGALLPTPASCGPLLGEGEARPDLTELIFLDTEATGLSAGAGGTYAFLVGLGRITPEGFEVTQYLMRDLPEEEAMLKAVARELAGKTLVTYNGRAFDWPLLRARFRLNGLRVADPPGHLDMLFQARRLWRRSVGSARLVTLEERVLGFERTGDLHSWLVPEAYFHFITEGREDLMDRILYHNALDIVSLAALTGLAGALLAGTPPAGFASDPLAMARIAELRRDPAGACREYRRALDAGMKPSEARELLPKLARLYRRTGDPLGAEWAWAELLTHTRGLYVDAYEPLARLCERRADVAAAREWCVKGLSALSRGLALIGGRVEKLRDRLRRRLTRLERQDSPRRHGRHGGCTEKSSDSRESSLKP
jgi:hypothetical protein